MGRLFKVHQHRQLNARNGDLVAGGGETVAADHQAVLELVDPASVGTFVEQPVAPQPKPSELSKPAWPASTETEAKD
jgi:hypothetical protein